MQMRYNKAQLVALSIGLVGVITTSYLMSQQRFWSYLPLGLFLATWTIIVSLSKKLLWSDDSKIKYLIYSTLSAIILSLGFPPLPLAPLMFVAFVPLMIASEKIEKSERKNRTLIQWTYAYHTFLVWNICTTFWVANSALIPAVAAFTLNSLFMTIPWMAAIWTGRFFNKLRWLSLPVFWMSWEYIHLNWEISWPWLSIGNSFASNVRWIQWYEFTGIFGGALWIWLINVLLFFWIKNRSNISQKSDFPKRVLYPIAILCSILIPLLISLYIFHHYEEKGRSKKVLIVQSNYEPHYQKFEVDEDLQFNKCMQLLEPYLADSGQLVIFPETSFGNSLPFELTALEADNRLHQWREMIVDSNHRSLLSGITAKRQYFPGEVPGPSARESRRRPGHYYEISNAALLALPESSAYYNKSRLVPGAEIFPYRKILPFLKPIVDMLGGSIEGFARQSQRTVFNEGDCKIAPVICYESIYGEFLAGFIRNGAEAICILTNDGWWDDTPGYKQHLMIGALRAIEFRRDIARAANTGISCTIDQRGIVHHARAYDTEGVVAAEIQLNDEHSLYSFTGDVIAHIAIAASAIFLILCLWKALRFRFKKRN
jgi:apolipoprotein N-acyltransferase